MSKQLAKFATVLALLAFLVTPSCSRQIGNAENGNVDHWTCTMHPSVREKRPGKCPICSMDLVPVMKQSATPANSSRNASHHDHGAMLAGKPTGGSEMQGMPGMEGGAESKAPQTSEFVVPVERQQQIGVTYAKVERRPLEHTIRSVGMIVPDKARNWQFVSRVDGYVQKLHVTAPGEIVEKDTPLMSIYSPDLLSTEREFVELLRMRDEAKSSAARETPERLIESSKRRLQLWNVTDEQIAEVEKTRNASETLTLLSPFRGVVQSVPVEQGKAVKVGDLLVEVADLSVVWVWADFYENELSMLQIGQKLAITVKSYPNEKFDGTISLINPFLDEAKRTSKVRIDISNPDFKLTPGMYANTELAMNMGEGLTVPVSAVMPTGTRSIVFVDRGEGKLEARIIELGAKYGDRYQVQKGLQENERVIASANFLIDAESKVQGALKDFADGGSTTESATPEATP